MPQPRERVARALCRLQGNPTDTQFEGKPMWQSFLDDADVLLAVLELEPILTLLSQIAADPSSSQRHREEAKRTLDTYLTGKRIAAAKAKTG